MAYDFEFYPNDGEMDEFWIFDGMGTPPGWEFFQWGNATFSITQGGGMYEGSNALTYVQGDVWSGGGFNIAPSLDLGDAFENGALMFWMWSEPDAPELRLQFEDGVGKVGTNFTPDPSGGWHQYGFYLDEFVFVDGSTDFNPNAVTVFQIMAEGNGLAGRTFHFDEMYISETEDEGEYFSFEFLGERNGHYYYVSQQLMSWHDGLNFTDTVDVGEDMLHMATITSPDENDFVSESLNSFDINSAVWLGLTDEFEEGNWQWVTGEPLDYTNWYEGEPNNFEGLEHYAAMWPWQSGEWNDYAHDFQNLVLIEYIPNDMPEEPMVEGTWKMAPMPGALRVGPAPYSGDWWANSADDVQIRACYFDDHFVFNADGSFQNVLGDETWLEWWQGVDAEQCGMPVYPHDGSNPATWDFNEETGQITLTGMGAYLGLPKAVNAGELPNVDVPESVTYNVSFDNGMMTLSN